MLNKVFKYAIMKVKNNTNNNNYVIYPNSKINTLDLQGNQ